MQSTKTQMSLTPLALEDGCMRKLISILLFLPIVASCATPSKSELDAEVKRLCASDGGISVFEKASLPQQYIDKYGTLRLPFEKQVTANDTFFLRHSTTILQEGNPSLSRLVSEVVRKSDGKILGRSVAYLRRGGDFPSPMHDSSLLCPEHSDLENQVFTYDKRGNYSVVGN